jgi:hypothetical protein
LRQFFVAGSGKLQERFSGGNTDPVFSLTRLSDDLFYYLMVGQATDQIANWIVTYAQNSVNSAVSTLVDLNPLDGLLDDDVPVSEVSSDLPQPTAPPGARDTLREFIREQGERNATIH